MRSPRHLEIKEQCRASIGQLMAQHQLGEAREIRVDMEGWVNPCFFVNDEYVFRFNARDPLLPKYHREKKVFDLLWESEIPVPKRVIHDTQRKFSPYDVLISQILEGENLEFAWSSLSRKHRQELATKAGRILRKLHSLYFDYFGEIANAGPLPRTGKWIDYLEAKLNYHLEEARGLKIFELSQEHQFRQALALRAPLLTEVKKSSLVHMDFHFGNLLFKDQDITGVLDFEWAIAGDPLYDLCFWQTGEETFPDGQAAFFAGYGQQDFSKTELERMKLYQMLKNVELTVVAHLHFPEEEAASYKGLTLNQLSYL